MRLKASQQQQLTAEIEDCDLTLRMGGRTYCEYPAEYHTLSVWSYRAQTHPPARNIEIYKRVGPSVTSHSMERGTRYRVRKL